MKLFVTNNIETVKCCQYYLGFDLPSVTLAKRTVSFEQKFRNNVYIMVYICNSDTCLVLLQSPY